MSQEDIERVDTLRYMWQKLHEQIAGIQTTLLKIQPKFRNSLLENVEAYQKEVVTFTEEYTTVSIILSMYILVIFHIPVGVMQCHIKFCFKKICYTLMTIQIEYYTYYDCLHHS